LSSAARRQLGVDLVDALAGPEVDPADVDRGVAVEQRELAVGRLLAEVLDLDVDLVRGLVGDVAPDV